MSDKSSESSCEWVVLDENEELCLDNEDEQSPDLLLSYDSVCDAVSESIRSSLSSEELEWQYEQFQDFIPQYRSSYIEELDYLDLDAKPIEELDVIHSENDDTSKFSSASDLEDHKDVEISPISKNHCYKHTRNDHINFVLNVMLVTVVALVVGLGIGHFLGWSHKCIRNTPQHKAPYSPNIPDSVLDSFKLPNAIMVMQIMERHVDEEKEVLNPASFSENLSDISCLDSKDSSSVSLHQGNLNDIVIDPVLPDSAILMSEDVQKFKTEEINQNNSSDVNLSQISSIVTSMNWNKIDYVTESLTNVNKPLESMNTQGAPSVDTDKRVLEKIFLFDINKISLTGGESAEEISSFSSDDFKDTENNENIELLKQIYIEGNEGYKESNLTNQLRQDLKELIQSLTTVALARFAQESNNPLSIENSGMIVKYYKDFENLVNLRLSEIDDFIMSSEYKKYEKSSLKHLQKMIYSLVDSVDYFMKVSIKTLSIRNKKIVVKKYLSNIDKVIFTFNKKWDKNNRYWSDTVRKINLQEEKSFKRENKYWKRKSQLEKDFRNKKYQRYYMKS